ncbi:hypothetical protein BGZ67_010174 [Mortierella alpina]|nr:hypothetical protein BGZ67_010174 [Mortierella alpina]
MFLPWSLVTANIILAVFQFLLIGTIGAVLAIYSRFGGDHANSIRWVRQGGYLELLSSVYNSWRRLLNSTKVALSLTICASLSASLADKGAAYFIAIADRQINPSFTLVNTSQFLPFTSGLLEPSGWSVNIRHGADIVDAMARRINDTRNIPNAVPVQRFRNVSATVFDNYNDMFEAMEASVNSATLQSTTNLFTEVKVSHSTIEMLACYSGQIPGLMCVYTIISTVVTKSKALDPIIVEARQGRPLSQSQGASFTVAMRILHTVASVNGTRQAISISTMKDATFAAAHYLALLGHNFYMDWNASQLYVIYDTADIETGLEVPLWLIWGIATIMLACLCFWAATEYFLDERCLGSLQKNIALSLGARLTGSAPMVMRSKFDPLEFEDVPILSHGIQHEVDT